MVALNFSSSKTVSFTTALSRTQSVNGFTTLLMPGNPSTASGSPIADDPHASRECQLPFLVAQPMLYLFLVNYLTQNLQVKLEFTFIQS